MPRKKGYKGKLCVCHWWSRSGRRNSWCCLWFLPLLWEIAELLWAKVGPGTTESMTKYCPWEKSQCMFLVSFSWELTAVGGRAALFTRNGTSSVLWVCARDTVNLQGQADIIHLLTATLILPLLKLGQGHGYQRSEKEGRASTRTPKVEGWKCRTGSPT
jgi:hypothetical protein